jgi:branched-subunit amino acid transport protein AzlD
MAVLFLVMQAALLSKVVPVVAQAVVEGPQTPQPLVVLEEVLPASMVAVVLAVLLRQPQQAQAPMGRPVLVAKAAAVVAREVVPLA